MASTRREVKEAVFLLWRGWCSVHQRFSPEHVAEFRAANPDGEVIVHPECKHEVVELADRVGSTERILEWATAAPAGAVIGVGTEIHMVQRMAEEMPDKTIVSLDPLVCPCSTMFRIDEPHLAWCLETLVAGGDRESDLGRRRDRGVVPRGASADARHHLTESGGPIPSRAMPVSQAAITRPFVKTAAPRTRGSRSRGSARWSTTTAAAIAAAIVLPTTVGLPLTRGRADHRDSRHRAADRDELA